MRFSRKIVIIFVALTLTLSLCLMAACGGGDGGGGTSKSDKVTEEQFDAHIDTTLQYFYNSTYSHFQLKGDIKMSSGGASLTNNIEYTRADGVDKLIERSNNTTLTTYRKYEGLLIKEYTKYGSGDWSFDVHENDDYYEEGSLCIGGILVIPLRPLMGLYDWFEYKNNCYSIKPIYTDLLLFALGYYGEDNMTLQEFTLSFKGDFLSAWSIKTSVSSVTNSQSYTFSYNNAPVTVPNAALEATGEVPAPGEITALQFWSHMEATASRLCNIHGFYYPLQITSSTYVDGNFMLSETMTRAGDEVEKLVSVRPEGYTEYYAKPEGGTVKIYRQDNGQSEWEVSETPYYKWEQDGGLAELRVLSDVLFTLSNYSGYFEYKYGSYYVRQNKLSDVYGLLLAAGMVSEDGELLELSLSFAGDNINGFYLSEFSFDVWQRGETLSSSLTFGYADIPVTIPSEVLDAETTELDELRFYYYMLNTAEYIKNLYNPVQLTEEYFINDTFAREREALRASDRTEKFFSDTGDESFTIYSTPEINRVRSYRQDNAGEWEIQDLNYASWEAAGGILGNYTGICSFFETLKDYFSFFEYRDQSYYVKQSYLTFVYSYLVTEGALNVGFQLSEYKVSFKNGRISVLSLTFVHNGDVHKTSYTFGYADIEITIPQAALNASHPVLTKAEFSAYMIDTLNYLNGVYNPAQISIDSFFNNQLYVSNQAIRGSDGIEKIMLLDGEGAYDIYSKPSGSTVTHYLYDYASKTWDVDYSLFADWSAFGGLMGFYIYFREYIEPFLNCYDWFQYKVNGYYVKSEYLTAAHAALLGCEIKDLDPVENGVLTDFSITFKNGKISKMIFYFSQGINEYCTVISFDYKNIAVTIPSDAPKT